MRDLDWRPIYPVGVFAPRMLVVRDITMIYIAAGRARKSRSINPELKERRLNVMDSNASLHLCGPLPAT